MTTSIVPLILAIMQVFPKIANQIIDAVTKHQQKQIQEIKDENYSNLQKKAAILLSINQTKDHKTKAILFSAYNDIGK